LLELVSVDRDHFLDEVESTGVVLQVVVLFEPPPLLLQFPPLEECAQPLECLLRFGLGEGFAVLAVPTALLPVFL
jgi:hypothetical protein